MWREVNSGTLSAGERFIIERLMQKNPANRYPTCADLIEILRPLALPGNAPARRPTMTMPRKIRRLVGVLKIVGLRTRSSRPSERE